MNALIAYYTWSGNTCAIAEMIQAETGGTLFGIRPTQPYPVVYKVCTAQAKQEIGAGYRPALEALPGDLAAWDTVFVGTPNWWSTIAPPVAAFLEGVDLRGKTVIPFCTHGGGGQARCAADIASLCPDARVLDGLAVYGGGSRQDVAVWLRRIGVTG